MILSHSAPHKPHFVKQGKVARLSVTNVPTLFLHFRFQLLIPVRPSVFYSPMQELEDMVCDSLATALSARSEVARLRRRCDAYEESVEKFRRKAQALRKQNQDLTQVFKRYVSDCRESASGRNGGRPAVPLKITRSVGLTVNITSTTVRFLCIKMFFCFNNCSWHFL